MNKSNANLEDYQVITRRTALLSVGTCKIVAEVKDRAKVDLYEIATAEDLQKVVRMEQDALYCDSLTFYREK